MMYQNYLKENVRRNLLQELMEKVETEKVYEHFSKKLVDEIVDFLYENEVPDFFTVKVVEDPEELAKVILHDFMDNGDHNIEYNTDVVVGEISDAEPNFNIKELNIVLLTKTEYYIGSEGKTYTLYIYFPLETKIVSEELEDFYKSLRD